MTTALAVQDTATLLRRNLLHMRRYPSLTVLVVGQPVVFLLLFVYVFGGTLITVTSVAAGTAISVAQDMTGGLVARLRTMAVSRFAILSGHVIGAMIKTVLALLVVIAVAVLLGLRTSADAAGWLGAIGMLLLAGFALTWLSVALGLASPSVEAASNWPIPLIFLPFLGSGFVPAASMPPGLRWFAEHQPFTPIMDTVRSLLAGAPVDAGTAWTAVAWCAAISVVTYLWARRLFDRVRVRVA